MWKEFAVRLCIGGVGLTMLGAAAQAQDGAELNAAMGYALEQGCLKPMGDGAVKAEAELTDTRPPHGNANLTVKRTADGCSISAAKGDGAQLRTALLSTLDAKGYTLTPFGVYEPYTNGKWSRVQETYCFRAGKNVYLATLSSSSTAKNRPFDVVIVRDSKGTSAAKGLCTVRA